MNKKVIVVGGGLAGCEAAYRIAEAGFPVELAEMKPVRFSPAHENENLAELVCSNSLKAKRLGSAAGLLKAEMLRLGSVTVEAALQTKGKIRRAGDNENQQPPQYHRDQTGSDRDPGRGRCGDRCGTAGVRRAGGEDLRADGRLSEFL